MQDIAWKCTCPFVFSTLRASAHLLGGRASWPCAAPCFKDFNGCPEVQAYRQACCANRAPREGMCHPMRSVTRQFGLLVVGKYQWTMRCAWHL